MDARLYAISLDEIEVARATQADCPSISIVSDADRSLVTALDFLHPGYAPDGGDANKPTKVIVRDGVVSWIHRTANLFERMPAEELLAAVQSQRVAN